MPDYLLIWYKQEGKILYKILVVNINYYFKKGSISVVQMLVHLAGLFIILKSLQTLQKHQAKKMNWLMTK